MPMVCQEFNGVCIKNNFLSISSVETRVSGEKSLQEMAKNTLIYNFQGKRETETDKDKWRFLNPKMLMKVN